MQVSGARCASLMFYAIAYAVSLMLVVLGGPVAFFAFGALQFVAVDELTDAGHVC